MTHHHPTDYDIPNLVAGVSIEPAPRGWFEAWGLWLLTPVVARLPPRAIAWLERKGVGIKEIKVNDQ